MSTLFQFLLDHPFWVLLVLVIIWRGTTLLKTLILEPIRGGNGVTQMNELSKFILLGLLCIMVYYEGKSVEDVYPESVFWIFVIGVFLIAGVKEFSIFIDNKYNKKP